ncbi:histidine--tRNA ligase [Ruminococcus sp.]|uniref:histidine--tRNA ligase n=1 Tax=Ruminococcus sp. TaxID=41978 RepID=UPI0025CF1C73|nr:histidine--tRNA ligase [Ruminococcus sp.]MBQ8965704.1 histidine--tRNA ligase [Ruminococcus sp.]
MAMIQRPKGTADMLPAQAYKWHTVEKLASDTAEMFGFKEIRVPTFEDTALFIRSVGETTDVVQKEMFTVSATGDDTFTLRPEGTAGVMRAVVENGLLNEAFPQKLYYITSCFRHENVQKGRLREFHQFGCEMVGSADARADADVISLAKNLMDRVGLRDIKLNINSIGCPTCRAKYQQALRDYFAPHRETLCDTCKERLEKNPMRLLDCKSPICRGIAKDAPLIVDYLCEECDAHFKALQKYLSLMNIDFEINPRIVRGLDYYTRTVFEFIAEGIGAQSTVCGGGRYDGLLNELCGKQVPALGFGMGLERLLLTMEQQNCDFMEQKTCDIYIASMGQAAAEKAMGLAMELRDEGFYAEYDLMGRGIKPQMKYADKIGSKFVLVIGDSELESGDAKLKNMATGEQVPVKLDGKFVENFSNELMKYMFKDIDGELESLMGKE